MEAEQAILAANDAFYRALEAMDIRAMRRVWAGRPTDVCVHPGWELLVGWADIEASWRAIFANTATMRFEITHISMEILGELARVSCVETIYTSPGRQGPASRVAATNLFLRDPESGAWRMALHHGSPIAYDEEEPEPEDVN